MRKEVDIADYRKVAFPTKEQRPALYLNNFYTS